MSKIGSANRRLTGQRPDFVASSSDIAKQFIAGRQSRQSRALWPALSRWPLSARAKLASANLRLNLRVGGAYRDRTDDPLLAKQVLSQLS